MDMQTAKEHIDSTGHDLWNGNSELINRTCVFRYESDMETGIQLLGNDFWSEGVVAESSIPLWTPSNRKVQIQYPLR